MKITIITVCYNNEKTIEDTIQSVLKQKYKDYEYLIIDGKSTDNTLQIINKFNDDKRINVLSEKDNGFYDALNKGIKLAKGDYIGIINADDILYDDEVFDKVIENIDNNTDIVCANVGYYNEDFSKMIRDYVPGNKYSNAWCPAHPSMYINKEVFNKIGYYDTNYRIASDYDFMVRCNINNIKYKYLNTYFVKMRYGGMSNGLLGYIKNFNECVKILRNNKVNFPILNTIKRTFITFKSYIN